MPSALELLREGRHEELWQKCCGFIDLSMDQFMTIQKRLLLEQIELLNRCELGKKVMRGARPRTVEEFRALVPITTYADYDPYLPQQIEDALPMKPMFWQRTSGRSEEFTFKWVPVTRRMYEELDEVLLAVLIIASCKGRGDIVLEEHDKFLYAMAPPPYASGCWGRRAAEWGIFDFLPHIEKAEKMEFEERMREGFGLALTGGVDILFAITGLLIMMADQFGQGGGLERLRPLLGKPSALIRILKALIISKLARRSLLPKDIWSLKVLLAFGTDTAVYREKLRDMWGRNPLDVYGSTETLMTAMHLWDYKDMTFFPQINFLEFVPEEQYRRFAVDHNYQPSTFLLDEVELNTKYGLVISNFYGGAYTRYFMGDIIKVTTLHNKELGVCIPQMIFDSRVEGLVELAGFVRLTERIVWQAIEDSGLLYQDWIATKDIREGKDIMNVYIEPKGDNDIESYQAIYSINERLKHLETYYSEYVAVLEKPPLQIIPIPRGAFQAYMLEQRSAGADLAHIKPPHMNPSNGIVEFLLNYKPAL